MNIDDLSSILNDTEQNQRQNRQHIEGPRSRPNFSKSNNGFSSKPNNLNTKEFKILDDYMSSYYVNEEDFLDMCLDKIGKGLKYIGIKTLEYLKKKYMIGKYSRNYRKRLNSYKLGKYIYKECVSLYQKIITDNNLNKELTNKFIMSCNKLNKICENFKEELPNLEYTKTEKAISNFEEVENYINMLNSRNKN